MYIRSRFAEHVEPGQSSQQVEACEELHEPRHPETPYAQRPVDIGTARRKTKQGLTTPDEVAGTQAKKTDGDRHERRTCKCEYLRFHFVLTFRYGECTLCSSQK